MGWGDAWAGLSQQAMGFAIDSLRSKEQQKYQTERDEIASKAQAQQEEARRNWEQKMLKMRADVDKSARKDEQMFRSTEAEKSRKFEGSQAAEQRDLTRSYYDQMGRSDQARIGLQAREMDFREKQAQAEGVSTPNGPTANRVDTALMQEYEILSQASDAEAKQAAAAIYASGLSNEEKLQRLRALRGRLGSNPQMEMIR